MLMNKIEELLKPFSLGFGKKQDLGTLLIAIRDSGVTYNDVIGYIEALKKQIQVAEMQNNKLSRERQSEWEKVAKRCPDCGFAMNLHHVNDSIRTKVGGGFKSQWFCNKCNYDIYSKKTAQEILKERRS